MPIYCLQAVRYYKFDTLCMLNEIAFYVDNIVECHDIKSLDEEMKALEE